jgi:hypothetical protein
LLWRNPYIIPSDALGGYAPAAAAPPIRIMPYYLQKNMIFSGNTAAS